MRNSRRVRRQFEFIPEESDSDSDGRSSSEVESLHESDLEFIISDEEGETWNRLEYEDLEGGSESDTESLGECSSLPEDEVDNLLADGRLSLGSDADSHNEESGSDEHEEDGEVKLDQHDTDSGLASETEEPDTVADAAIGRRTR